MRFKFILAILLFLSVGKASYGNSNTYKNHGHIASTLSKSNGTQVKLVSCLNQPMLGISHGSNMRISSGKIPFDLMQYGWGCIEEKTFEESFENQNNYEISQSFQLYGNYPNPFNPTTLIKYYLPDDTKVTVKIYKMLGQEIRTLVNENQSAGEKNLLWDGLSSTGQKLSSGVYICQIRAGSQIQSIKMVLMK